MPLAINVTTDIPEGWEKEVTRAIEEEFRVIGLEMEREMADALDEFGITYQGDAKKSITSEVKREARAVELTVGPTVRHAAYMYFGTRPHWPPRQPIEQWVRRKLGVPPRRLESATYLVRRKIATEGTRGYRNTLRDFLGAVTRAFRGDIKRRIEGRVVERLTGSIPQG